MGTWLSTCQLPRLLACELYLTTQSSKIFKYFLTFSVLMDRKLNVFHLLHSLATEDVKEREKFQIFTVVFIRR